MAPTREAPLEILAEIPINGENRARTFTSQESVNSYSFFKLGTSAQGGVAQICLYKGFINKEEDKASLSDAIRHINHIVALIGIDHVGIGSDFDGDGELIGCSATNELINITVRLLEEGYTEEDIRKIWGGNLRRVMTAIQDFPNK